MPPRTCESNVNGPQAALYRFGQISSLVSANHLCVTLWMSVIFAYSEKALYDLQEVQDLGFLTDKRCRNYTTSFAEISLFIESIISIFILFRSTMISLGTKISVSLVA